MTSCWASSRQCSSKSVCTVSFILVDLNDGILCLLSSCCLHKQGTPLSRQKLIRASPILNLILPTFLHFGTQSHRCFVTTSSYSVINLRRVPYASAKSNCLAPPNMLSFPWLCSSFFFCLQFPISDLCPCKSVLKQSSRISSSTSLPEKISRVSVNIPKEAGLFPLHTLNTRDTCRGRTQHSVNDNEGDNRCWSLTHTCHLSLPVPYSAQFMHGVKCLNRFTQFPLPNHSLYCQLHVRVRHRSSPVQLHSF